MVSRLLATLSLYVYMGICVKADSVVPTWLNQLGVNSRPGLLAVPDLKGWDGLAAGHRLRAQKRKGDFSCETSPSLFRLSEIRFGFRITILVFPELLGTRELTLARSLLF